jgi:hypothetical protein
MDCLFFLTWEGSPTSREEYPEGIVVMVREVVVEAVTTPERNIRLAISEPSNRIVWSDEL